MTQRLVFRVLLALTLLGISASALFAQGRVVGRFGEANIGPYRAIVHVTVVVPPGLEGNAIAEEALRGQGARPFQPAEFSLTGLGWDAFLPGGGGTAVQLNYNSAGAPAAAADFVPGRVQDALNTWTNVTWSKFTFADLGSTGRCPSLVKECPDAQVNDGYNDIGWANIKGCCTLAVTWYTAATDETDMAFNSKFNWTDTAANYNLQTVALHEIGHVLGLGHSTAAGSIMQATYAGYQIALGTDDVRGITYLYPELGFVSNITGNVSSNTGSAIQGATVSIADFPASAAAITNSAGDYTIVGIPTIGTYTVTASASGYTSKTTSNVSSGTTVDFSLSPSTGGGRGGRPF